MFKHIMVPVDLAHLDTQRDALSVAAGLAGLHGAPLCYVGVTTSQPSALAHDLAEYEEKLAAFAAGEAERHGHQVTHRSFIGHDPTTDVDDTLLAAVEETGADLVVMASHHPRATDRIWPSNGGKLATHADVSIFLVRSPA